MAVEGFGETFAFISFFTENALNIVCYITGGILLFSAAMRFNVHRTNPQLYRMSIIIIYLILGIFAIFIPTIASMSHDIQHKRQYASKKSKLEQYKQLFRPDVLIHEEEA
jgi:hypothetical protein